MQKFEQASGKKISRLIFLFYGGLHNWTINGILPPGEGKSQSYTEVTGLVSLDETDLPGGYLMRRPRLDLPALRTRRLPRLPRSGFSAIDLLDNQSRLSFTRREMLGLAGTAAATLPLQFGAPEGRLQFVPGHKRVAFRLDGREQWVIDTRRFAGAPALRVSQSRKLVRVALVNARYPGTGLPADLECKLERAAAGWRMHLRMALGGFQGEAPFERWLRGKAELRSAVQLDRSIAGFGNSSKLVLSGRAQAEFLPNWTLRVEGKGIARLSGFGGDSVADSLLIGLLDPADPSIVSRPRERRTLLAMNRGNRSWPFRPLLGGENVANLAVSDTAFDRIRIETGEDAGGAAGRALLAESQSGRAGMTFIPAGNFAGSDGAQFRVPLGNARYAITADAAGRQAALIANYADEPAWVHAEGCSFEVGDSPDAPAFEAVSVNGQAPRVRCAPALKQIAAPLPGVIVQARPVREGTQLAFLGQNETQRVIIQREQTTKQTTEQPSQKKQIRIPNIRLGTIRVVQEKGKAKKKKGVIVTEIRQQYGPSFTFDLIRPDDLLALTFDFFNMNLAAGGGAPRLVRVDPNQPAYLVVHFGPQHIAEEAFFESSQPTPIPKKTGEPPILSRLAGSSRLAFIVPGGVAEIPYTLESLLNWAQFEQSVTPLAKPPVRLTLGTSITTGSGTSVKEPQVQAIQESPQYYQQVAPSTEMQAAPVTNAKKNKKKRQSVIQQQTQARFFQLNQVKAPEIYQTALEVPYRMILSPSYYAGWAHSAKAVEHGGAFELWHTRLGVRSQQGAVDEQSDFYRTVRAVWATDYRAGCLPDDKNDATPFETKTINTRQRYEIVRLSSDPNISYNTGRGYANYTPQPIQVNRLMLSTLGAWLNSNGVWAPPEDVREPACPGDQKFSFNVESWRHIAAVGRDQYVRIVERGYLFPFGHRAVKVAITERKFNRTPSGKMAAYLRKQEFVVVREHEKSYPAIGQPYPQGPKLPFQSVRINTLSTPPLDKIDSILPGENAFWPRVAGQDFQFKMVGVDWEGKTSEFTSPLIFVLADPARDTVKLKDVFKAYKESADPRRVRPFFGQKVAYAKQKVPGDTTFETSSMTFEAEQPDNPKTVPPGQPYFYPAIANSAVRIATVEQLTGRNAATSIEYHDTYLNHGIEAAANQGQLFAKLVDTVPLSFGGAEGGADKVGGLLTPNMDISGLSRLLGPVAGDLPTIAGGKFDPKQFFSSALDAKLLGDISLADVISTVTNFQSDIKKVPKFITSHLKDAIEISFTWEPDSQDVKAKVVKDDGTTETKGNPFFVAKSDKTKTTKPLVVSAKLTKRLDGKPPNYEVKAVMTNFELHLVPAVIEVLIIKFNELSFTSVNGKKPDVNADLLGVEFTGPLSFVNTLQNLIPTNGFKDPPSLQVTAEGIEAGYSLGLPPVSVGVFNLSNVSLAAKLNIYFTGKPITFEFDFCQEHQPFLLTVSLFGGGGYFGLTLTPSGVQRMAAEFEFGGNFSLNIGVASGGVYVMAGFEYTHANGNTELSGYLRCGGALEVLAIITVSVEFKMGLKYVSEGNKVWGRATLTVEIKIAFFSKSVDLTVERQFAGSGTQTGSLFGAGAPYPLGPTAVHFADEMGANDWQLYCEAFA